MCWRARKNNKSINDVVLIIGNKLFAVDLIKVFSIKCPIPIDSFNGLHVLDELALWTSILMRSIVDSKVSQIELTCAK